MNWGGKIVGAAAGAAIFGPIGAAIGAMVGHWCDGSGVVLTDREQNFLPYFAGLAAASMIDGKPLPAAKRRAFEIGRHGFQTMDTARLEILWNEAVNNLPSPEAFGVLFHDLEEGLRMTFAHGIFSVLYADGVDIGEARRQWAATLAEHSKLDSEFWLLIDAFYVPSELTAYKAACLAELALPTGASEADVRSAYRALSRDYHPDLHSSASGPLKKLAEDKMKRINEAYDHLSSGFLSIFQVQKSDTEWVCATSVEDGSAIHCPACLQANRVSKRSLLNSRCGNCHAQLALHKDFAATLDGRP